MGLSSGVCAVLWQHGAAAGRDAAECGKLPLQKSQFLKTSTGYGRDGRTFQLVNTFSLQ